MKTHLLLILFACCLMIQPRAFTQDQPAAQPSEQPRGNNSVLPPNEDPNDPNASPEERIARQRKLIQRKINERMAMQKSESEGKGSEARLRTTLEQIQTTTSTEAVVQKLPEMILELNREIGRLREQVYQLMNQAEPQLKEEAEKKKPFPPTYKVEAVVTLEGGKSQNLLDYGADKFKINTPLIFDPPADSDQPRLVGEMNLVGSFEDTAQDKVLLQYEVSLSYPVLKKESYGQPDKKQTSYRQESVNCNTHGKTTLRFGEAKEIARLSGNVVTITVTPDKK